MNKYHKYYKCIRLANPHIRAERVLEYIKTIEKIHGLRVLNTILYEVIGQAIRKQLLQ